MLYNAHYITLNRFRYFGMLHFYTLLWLGKYSAVQPASGSKCEEETSPARSGGTYFAVFLVQATSGLCSG